VEYKLDVLHHFLETGIEAEVLNHAFLLLASIKQSWFLLRSQTPTYDQVLGRVVNVSMIAVGGGIALTMLRLRMPSVLNAKTAADPNYASSRYLMVCIGVFVGFFIAALFLGPIDLGRYGVFP
jgi:NhaP-type Na+/H+ or K+/H+ antiporter